MKLTQQNTNGSNSLIKYLIINIQEKHLLIIRTKRDGAATYQLEMALVFSAFPLFAFQREISVSLNALKLIAAKRRIMVKDFDSSGRREIWKNCLEASNNYKAYYIKFIYPF